MGSSDNPASAENGAAAEQQATVTLNQSHLKKTWVAAGSVLRSYKAILRPNVHYLPRDLSWSHPHASYNAFNRIRLFLNRFLSFTVDPRWQFIYRMSCYSILCVRKRHLATVCSCGRSPSSDGSVRGRYVVQARCLMPTQRPSG